MRIDYSKAQDVRLMDVFLLGPFMVLAGTAKRLPPWARLLMVAAGMGTILYNARNYARIRR